MTVPIDIENDKTFDEYNAAMDDVARSGRFAITVLSLSKSQLRARTPRETVALKQIETLLGKSVIELHDNISMLMAAQERLRAATFTGAAFSEGSESAGIVTF